MNIKRTKSFAYLFATSLLSVTVAGCGKQSVPSNKMNELILEVDQFTDFGVGDLFSECANYAIKGRYEDGLTYTLDESKYQIIFMRYSSIIDINDRFELAGDYSLRVKSVRYGLYSNTFTFNVTPQHMYTTKLEVSGPYSVAKGQTVRMTVETDGQNFGGDITCTCANPSYVTINKVGPRAFDITGSTVKYNDGDAKLAFTAHKSATETISVEKDFEVVRLTQTDIKQTIGDYRNKKTFLCPSIGNPKVLVIPIWFTSGSSTFIQPDMRDNVIEDLEIALFGTKEQTGWHSLSSYYYEESKGLVNITGTVSEWYETSADGSIMNNNHINDIEPLLKNAVDYYFGTHPTDSRANYDDNHDGYIDTVIGVPAYTGIRGFATRLSNVEANVSSPSACVYNWVSVDRLYNVERAQERIGTNYSCGDCKNRLYDPTIFIHEFGHALGLVDLYDSVTNYDGAPPKVDYTGSFNLQTDNRCGHDPYSVMIFGWADPYIPTTSGIVTINDFQSSHELILLTPQWNAHDSPFDEYLLLELYTPTGLNEYDTYYNSGNLHAPDAVGIKVWHIDSILYQLNFGGSGSFFTTDCHDFGDGTDTNRPIYAFSNGYQSSYMFSKMWKYYSLVRLLRSPHSVAYITTDKFKSSDLFVEGERFVFSNYADQFANYENNRIESLDLGQELGWSFKVLGIYDNGNGTYSASIDLTKV